MVLHTGETGDIRTVLCLNVYINPDNQWLVEFCIFSIQSLANEILFSFSIIVSYSLQYIKVFILGTIQGQTLIQQQVFNKKKRKIFCKKNSTGLSGELIQLLFISWLVSHD